MNEFLADFILDDIKTATGHVDFSEIKGKDILITGASGLLGHYFVAAIRNAAAQGNVPRKLFLAVKNDLPEYFQYLTTGLPVEFLKGELTDDDFLRGFPSADYIIHAAGYGQPGKFTLKPIVTLKLNTLVTFKLIEKLNKGGKFLFLSSSEVYSGLPNPPYHEDQIGTTNTNHPRSCYIEGKRGGEAIVNAYRLAGADAKAVRLSLAYGPGTRADDARVLNNFIKKAVVDGKIELLDQGVAKRTYLYVTDAIELMFDILFFGKQDIYNVGGNSRTTIGELAKTIGRQVNVPVSFPATSHGVEGAPDDVVLDMTRASTEFNKKDFIQLEEGLRRTIAWQKELYAGLKA
jgi:nucleoside-diphosphate-sugar epimerase